MKKLINIFTAILTLSLIMLCAVNALATEDSPAPDINLFDRQGDYVRQNPFGKDEIHKSWHLNGKNVITNSDTDYPISISNKTGEDSFYYVAGSNSISDLADDETPIRFLENDFTFEYEVTYAHESDGHISLVMAYNYSYYVDAYISSNGTGDISIVTPSGAVSYMDSESILDTQNPDELLRAIYGRGKSAVLRDKMIISVRVSVDENKMPEKIHMYLNGCLVAETNGEFALKVKELTPEYTIEYGNTFPEDTLGNIIAIKSSDGSVGQIGSTCVYSVDNDDYTPDGHAAKHYSQYYGNESFDESMYPELEENSTEESAPESSESATEDATEESTESSSSDTTEVIDELESNDSTEEHATKRNRYEDDEDEEYLDVISTMCLILGCASAAIILAAVVILKLRTKEK